MPPAALPECPLTVIDAGQETPAHVTGLLGTGLTVFCFTDDAKVPAQVAAFADTMEVRSISLTVMPLARKRPSDATSRCAWDPTGRLFGMYGAAPGTVYLARPDGHVLGRWQVPEAEQLSAAVAHLLHS